MGTYNFEIHLEPEQDGRWSAWLASYPACGAWGDTKDEALEALADMSLVFLGVMADAGESVYADSVEPRSDYGVIGAGLVNLGGAVLDGMASVSNDLIRIPVPA